MQPNLNNQIQIILGTNQAIITPSQSSHTPVSIKPAPVQKSSATTTPVQSWANVVKWTGGGGNVMLTLPINTLGMPLALAPPFSSSLKALPHLCLSQSLPASQPSMAVAEEVETVLIETTADDIIQAGNNLLIVQHPGGGQPAEVQVVPPNTKQQQVV